MVSQTSVFLLLASHAYSAKSKRRTRSSTAFALYIEQGQWTALWVCVKCTSIFQLHIKFWSLTQKTSEICIEVNITQVFLSIFILWSHILQHLNVLLHIKIDNHLIYLSDLSRWGLTHLRNLRLQFYKSLNSNLEYKYYDNLS